MSSAALSKLKADSSSTASKLNTLATKLASSPPTRIETQARRVRVLFNQKIIADTSAARFVWEHPYYPCYYLPSKDVKTNYIEKVEKTDSGEAYICRLIVGDRGAGSVLWFEKGVLSDLIKFEFKEMGILSIGSAELDSWFEEDTEIYVHPKDPYKRVDIIPSTKHIVVKVNDIIVAESSSPLLLFETGLMTRYYLPKTSVNFELLEPSDTLTSCPYKGQANYYSIVIDGKEYKDHVWWYQYPTPESIAIAGRVCFYNEKVDIYIDGEKEKR
jgi:uncharacterized protein (DUF427 family)